MAQKQASFVYNKDWLQGLVKELYIAQSFTQEILDIIRKYSYNGTLKRSNAMVAELQAFEKKVPKLEKLKDVEDFLKATVRETCENRNSRKSCSVKLTVLLSSLSDSILLFSSEFRAQLNSKIEK